MTAGEPVGRYRLRVFHRSEREALADLEGRGEQWRDWAVVRVRALDDRFTLRLEGVWAALLEGGGGPLDVELEGLCTVVKFGDTLQLRETFRVLAEALGDPQAD